MSFSKINFNSDITQIEKDLVEFLTKSQFFIGEKNSTAEIISFFIARKELTQNKLKELTGLSKGTISQELNDLLKRKIIEEKEGINGKIKIYTMDSIINGFINSYLSAVKDYLKYKKEFTQIKIKLEQEKEKLQNYEEYDTIYKFVKIFLDSIPITEKIIEMLKIRKEK